MSVEELDSHAGPVERLRREEPEHILALDDPAWSGAPEDEPDEPSLTQWLVGLWRRIPHRGLLVPATAVALVLGLLVGVSATHEWRDRGERIAADRQVFLVATPNTAPSGQSRLEDDRAETMTFLDLTNGGPLAITMTGIRIDAAGIVNRPLRNPLVLEPGRPRTLPLASRIDCGPFEKGEPSRLLATVRTADGTERELPLALPRQRLGGNLFEQDLCTREQDRDIFAEFVDLQPPSDNGIVTFSFRVRRGQEPYLIDDVEMPWSDRAWVQTPDRGPQVIRGRTTLVLVGAHLKPCRSYERQSLDSSIELETRSLQGRRYADSPVSLGGRYQLELLAAITAACGVPGATDAPSGQSSVRDREVPAIDSTTPVGVWTG